jgi:hypothetical protein
VTDAPTERARDGTWTSVHRRKVVQWGLVYVAASWGFLQGLEYVGESFHWPEQLRQIALIALLIGLPVVLVLAWYHGDRGLQRISTAEFAILQRIGRPRVSGNAHTPTTKQIAAIITGYQSPA